MTLKEARDMVNFFIEEYGEDAHCAIDLWTREDVESKYEIDDIKDIDNILDLFHDDRDCNKGLNWEQLELVVASYDMED